MLHLGADLYPVGLPPCGLPLPAPRLARLLRRLVAVQIGLRVRQVIEMGETHLYRRVQKPRNGVPLTIEYGDFVDQLPRRKGGVGRLAHGKDGMRGVRLPLDGVRLDGVVGRWSRL